MGCDQQTFDLLVRVVGQREDDPIGLGAALLGSDLDTPHDAVRAGRGRDLDAVTLAGEPLDDGREVDRRAVERHPHSFDRASWLA